MLFHFSKFSATAFFKKPQTVILEGKWQVEYLSFCRPENIHKTPLVFLGGAFQNFFSFKKEVQVLMEHFPILLVDLPSQGSNKQLCPQLQFEDFARLLQKFVEKVGAKKITPIGLSYGSAMAFTFAAHYPENVDKLIIAGITNQIRPSLKKLLEDSILTLKEKDMDAFSEGAVLNLINYPKRETTQISPRIITAFHRGMKKLTENEKQRYIDNTQRLLDLKGVGKSPTCPTLILTGQYDHFTTTYESFEIFKSIPQGKFLMVEGGDHLGNLEKRDTVIKTYLAYVNDSDLSDIEGIKDISHLDIKKHDRRLDPRLRPEQKTVTLEDHKNCTLTADIEDINYHGCKLSFNLENKQGFNFSERIKIHIPAQEPFTVDAYLFDESKGNRFIFRRCQFKKSERLENYIQSLS